MYSVVEIVDGNYGPEFAQASTLADAEEKAQYAWEVEGIDVEVLIATNTADIYGVPMDDLVWIPLHEYAKLVQKKGVQRG